MISQNRDSKSICTVGVSILFCSDIDEDRTDEGAQDWNASFVIKLAESLETSRLPVAHIYTDILEICLIPLENV